jgi:hypothetical protein
MDKTGVIKTVFKVGQMVEKRENAQIQMAGINGE